MLWIVCHCWVEQPFLLRDALLRSLNKVFLSAFYQRFKVETNIINCFVTVAIIFTHRALFY